MYFLKYQVIEKNVTILPPSLPRHFMRVFSEPNEAREFSEECAMSKLESLLINRQLKPHLTK